MSTTRYAFLEGTTEMHRLVAEHDWSNTNLGPIDTWSDVLALSVSLCLNSRFPVILWWGRELTVVYNDPYIGRLQSKHPRALGRPGSEVWNEIWPVVGPMLEGVLKTGKATWSDDQLLFLERNGYPEETYHTFSYSAIKDRFGKILGVFTPVTETTQKVISSRHLDTLKNISSTRSTAEAELCAKLSDILSNNREDLQFAVLVQVSGNRQERILIDDKIAFPSGAESILAFLKHDIEKALESGSVVTGEEKEVLSNNKQRTSLGLAAQKYVVAPIIGQHQSDSFLLLAGASPHLPLDQSYLEYVANLARELSAAIKEIRALEAEKRRAQQSASMSSNLQALVDRRTKELEEVGSILSDFVDDGDFRQASRQLLQRALAITHSEYGFIGATIAGGRQGIILRLFADLGFKWSATASRELYEKIISDYETKGYVDFPRLDNLIGWPILNRQVIICNDPDNDPRRSGRQPKGHPPMNSFLGIPIFKGESVVGLLGLANKKGSYSDADVLALNYLVNTASVIFDSYRRVQYENRILQERAVAEDNLRRANEALLELAYSVSHELQEPLAKLRGDLSLLSARYKNRLGTDADQFINDALQQNMTINAMVDDLWVYARIDRGQHQFEEISLDELFDKTVITFESVIKANSTTITRDDLPVVRAQRDELSVLFEKLLDNALKFSKPGSQIHLSVDQLVDEWLFCMTDSGIGFLQTEAHEIFKMFRKLSRGTPGTGMGLPICKRIVEFHGGRMWAESEPNKGSKFYFTIPLIAIK